MVSTSGHRESEMLATHEPFSATPNIHERTKPNNTPTIFPTAGTESKMSEQSQIGREKITACPSECLNVCEVFVEVSPSSSSSSSCPAVARIWMGGRKCVKIRGEADNLKKFQKRANLLVRHLSNRRTAEMLKSGSRTGDHRTAVFCPRVAIVDKSLEYVEQMSNPQQVHYKAVLGSLRKIFLDPMTITQEMPKILERRGELFPHFFYPTQQSKSVEVRDSARGAVLILVRRAHN